MKRFKDLRIGSWNILSLYKSKSLQMLLDQLEKYYVGRKKTEVQAETKMGRWCDGRCQKVGGQKLEECCKE